MNHETSARPSVKHLSSYLTFDLSVQMNEDLLSWIQIPDGSTPVGRPASSSVIGRASEIEACDWWSVVSGFQLSTDGFNSDFIDFLCLLG